MGGFFFADPFFGGKISTTRKTNFGGRTNFGEKNSTTTFGGKNKYLVGGFNPSEKY